MYPIIRILLIIPSFIYCLHAQCSMPFEVHGGSEFGTYNSFIKNINDLLATEGQIIPIVSAGSEENIRRLHKGDAEFAIVQDDVAYSSYHGGRGYTKIRGYKVLLPLFPNYVQVLVKDKNEFNHISQLMGKKIGVGLIGSATYNNAIDVLDAAGLKSSENFTAIQIASGPGLDALQRAEIDALFITGKPRTPPGDLAGHIEIPISIIKKLSTQFPYYTVMPAPNLMVAHGAKGSVLTLTAYLMVSDSVKEEKVVKLLDLLLGNWSRLESNLGYILNPADALLRQPVPFRSEVRIALDEYGYIEAHSAPIWMLLTLLLIVSLAFFPLRKLVRGRKFSRLGKEILFGTGFKGRVLYYIMLIATLMAALLLIFTLLASASIWLEWLEARYAREYNLSNAFGERGFLDGVIWTVTFMVSGYPNEMYPISPGARVLSAAIAMSGIALPIYLIVWLLSAVRKKRANRAKGLARYYIKDHVLVCGWSRKVPGVVEALTSKDSPSIKEVIIVAEMQEEKPLERHGFNSNLVHYCRGDATDLNVLSKASAGKAKYAIVINDPYKEKDNLDSILSVLALKDINPNIFVVAEVNNKNYVGYYEASSVDAGVDIEIVSNRLCSLSCVNMHACNFVLDCLTYDEHSELYSLSLSEIKERLGIDFIGDSYSQIISRAIKYGINILGVVNKGKKNRGVVDGDFSENVNINLLRNAQELKGCGAVEDVLVFFADDIDKRSFRRNSGNDWREGAQLSSQSLINAKKYKEKILIIGIERRIADVTLELSFLGANVEIDKLNIENMPFENFEKAIGDAFYSNTYSKIILLNDTVADDALLPEEANSGDVKNIIRTEIISNLPSVSVKIIAEVNLLQNKMLMVNAGAQCVIPLTLLSQRFMAKMIYGKGYVSELLISLLTGSDGIYLKHEVVSEDSNLKGMTFENVLAMRFQDGRVLAVLPKKEDKLEKLINHRVDRTSDIADGKGTALEVDTHFMLAPTKKHYSYTLKIGDSLIYID